MLGMHLESSLEMTVSLRHVKISSEENPADSDYTPSSKPIESDESNGSDDSEVVNQVIQVMYCNNT